MAQILIIEDEQILARNIRDALQYAGHEAQAVGTGEEGLEHLRTSSVDLVILDLRLPKMDGMDVLRTLRSQQNDVPIIIMTAHGTIDTAVEAMKCGANDFLTKPLDLKALQMLADRVLNHQRVVENLDYFRNRERADSGVETILGVSPHIESVRSRIRKLVASPALASEFPPSILITGETGTGKDLVARAIHYEGPRRDAPFVQVNCTALPETLFESELFGHVKGAFTGAQGSKKGLMEVANGGTIFFDEIGHLKPALQAKLLTAIEQKKIRPVGGTAERSVDVLVISATNRDLDAAIKAGEFREDLFHRLRVIPLHLISLRERPEDIELLARHFVALHAKRCGLPVTGISDEAMELVVQYDWPGNVRELSHALESAVYMCDHPLIAPDHLQIRARPKVATTEVALPGSGTITVDFNRGGPVLEDLEHEVLEAALTCAGRNLSRAARMLGITREAVRYRLEKHRTRRGQPPDGD